MEEDHFLELLKSIHHPIEELIEAHKARTANQEKEEVPLRLDERLVS